MKVYISGKISGLDFEAAKAKFAKVEDFLNGLGYEAINPFENGLSETDPWIKHLCKDLELLHGCDCLYMLDGWEESTGACVEYYFARRTGKETVFHSNNTIAVRQALDSIQQTLNKKL